MIGASSFYRLYLPAVLFSHSIILGFSAPLIVQHLNYLPEVFLSLDAQLHSCF